VKKRIIIGMSFVSLIFLAGGIYLIANIQMATATLDNLIKLHQVEIIREHLLIQIKKVQSDLYLKNTRYARNIDTVMRNVENMTAMSNVCFKCHHSEPVMKSLITLRNEVEIYKDALSRVITMRANNGRLSKEEDAAFSIGEDLISRVNDIINFSQLKLEEKTEASMKKIAQTKMILFILVPLGPLLAIGLAFIFIRDMTRPLNAILEATRSLKAGNLGYRIGGLKDEFGEVAASFNEMAGSLNEQVSNMQRAEQMTVVGEMAASIAHEIKNPLAGIKIALNMLIENKNLSEAESDITRASFSQIKRVESLIKEVLDFARPKEPQYALTDVNAVIDKTVSFIEAVSVQANNGAGVRVVKALATDVPELLVDPMQIQQAVMNIVLNAYDAMPQGGTLAVESAVANNSFVVTISDTGSGIDPQIMGKLFKPFFTTKAKGTGLGLAIIKGIVERHGGTIDIANGADVGTSVTLALPMGRNLPAAPAGGQR
jgi:signal transduction histidine kinase